MTGGPFPTAPCAACGYPVIRVDGTVLEPEPSLDPRAHWFLEWRNGAPFAIPDAQPTDDYRISAGLFAKPKYRLHMAQCQENKKAVR